MENGNVNGGYEFLQNDFWSNYSALKERVNTLKRKNIPLEQYDPIRICEDIENLLSHEEEENLTFLQNKIRKLSAGSELCRHICVIQRHFSRLEINRAVSEVLEEAKHEKITNRILSRRALENKREKYFLKQALETIRSSIGDETDEEGDEEEGAVSVSASVRETQRNLEDTNPRLNTTDIIPNLDLTQPEKARGIDSELANGENADLRMSKASVAPRRMTEIPEPLQDVSIPEVEQRHSLNEYNSNADFPELEDISSGRIPEPQQDISGEPDVPEPITENITPDLENLPPVITPPKKRKKSKPGFDRSITIPNYLERARRLNESIVIERIQVYEGPPSLIQAFSIRHLFETPARNNGFSKTVRSSVLERLYSRHQKTQKMKQTDGDVSFVWDDLRKHSRSEAPKSNVVDASHLGERESEVKRQDVPVEEELVRLIGTPISKIVQRDVAPPPVPIGSSDPWLPSRSPRIENLQGTRIEPPIAEPWFKAIEQPAPDEKWREFDYVRTRLKEVWMRVEAERKASLRDILDEEWNKENFLTVLRILDKMSLNREIFIEGHGENIVIYPFEIPYVTEKQYSLSGAYPKY